MILDNHTNFVIKINFLMIYLEQFVSELKKYFNIKYGYKCTQIIKLCVKKKYKSITFKNSALHNLSHHKNQK